jgi:hypothetical protein
VLSKIIVCQADKYCATCDTDRVNVRPPQITEVNGLRSLGFGALAVIWLVGLELVASVPALSQPSGVTLSFDLNDGAVAKEIGSRRERHRYDRPRYRNAKRLYQYRGYFGTDPDRYFGVGPDSYECYGYDCNW